MVIIRGYLTAARETRGGVPPAVENFSQEVLPNLYPKGMDRLKEGRKGLRAGRQRSRRNRTPSREMVCVRKVMRREGWQEPGPVKGPLWQV